MSDNLLKGVAMAFLLSLWAYLVSIGKADAPSLVEFVKAAILLISGHTIFSGGSKP